MSDATVATDATDSAVASPGSPGSAGRHLAAALLILAVALALILLLPLPALAAAQISAGPGVSLPEQFEQALAASRDGRFSEALPLWDDVLEQDPSQAAAWSNRGNVRLALGDPEGAIEDQGRAMALDPLNPDPHLNRGTAEEALQRWQAAAADYT
jgi:tetratricopeptide (TPR) repeat protein